MKDQLITFLRRSIWFLLNLQRYHIKAGKFPEGFEIKFLEEDFPVIEFRDWTDLEGLTTDEVVELIDDHIDFEQHFN